MCFQLSPGVRLEKDVEAEEEAEADERERSNGLWNAQPFRQPPAAPLPECPAGCARAQPVQVPQLWGAGQSATTLLPFTVLTMA
jgi:hypothetical protein